MQTHVLFPFRIRILAWTSIGDSGVMPLHRAKETSGGIMLPGMAPLVTTTAFEGRGIPWACICLATLEAISCLGSETQMLMPRLVAEEDSGFGPPTSSGFLFR